MIHYSSAPQSTRILQPGHRFPTQKSWNQSQSNDCQKFLCENVTPGLERQLCPNYGHFGQFSSSETSFYFLVSIPERDFLLWDLVLPICSLPRKFLFPFLHVPFLRDVCRAFSSPCHWGWWLYWKLRSWFLFSSPELTLWWDRSSGIEL